MNYFISMAISRIKNFAKILAKILFFPISLFLIVRICLMEFLLNGVQVEIFLNWSSIDSLFIKSIFIFHSVIYSALTFSIILIVLGFYKLIFNEKESQVAKMKIKNGTALFLVLMIFYTAYLLSPVFQNFSKEFGAISFPDEGFSAPDEW